MDWVLSFLAAAGGPCQQPPAAVAKLSLLPTSGCVCNANMGQEEKKNEVMCVLVPFAVVSILPCYGGDLPLVPVPVHFLPRRGRHFSFSPYVCVYVGAVHSMRCEK